MSSARELLAEFFDCLEHLDTSIDRCVDLFAEDGVFEFPYFASLGLPTRFEDKAAVREVLGLIRARFTAFSISNVTVHERVGGHGLFAEYHSDGFIDGTERVYAQDYASRLDEEGGRIKLLREYMNVISTARMMFPDGLAGVPAPKN